MPPDPHGQPERIIAHHERRQLDSLKPPGVAAQALLDGHEFIRIRKISKLSNSAGRTDFIRGATELAIGGHAFDDYLTFVVAGSPRQVAVYYALSNANIAKILLRSAYPGLEFGQRVVCNLGTQLRDRFAHVGMISGIPSRRLVGDDSAANRQEDTEYLERVIRGMRGSTWVYLVQAYPRPRDEVTRAREEVLTRIAAVASVTRKQVQRSTQASQARTAHQTQTVSETMGGEIVDRTAQYAVELLELEVKRLEAALAVGRWQVAVYYGASGESDALRLGALLAGLLSGPESRPDPIRAHLCRRHSTSASNQFHTYLSSAEVALLVEPPKEEAPGYAVADVAKFDVDVDQTHGQHVVVGEVQWDSNPSGIEYSVSVDDFARHGVVFGVTGSGKTTTIMGLLHSLWNDFGIPFIVLEPAKTEYRALLGLITDGKAKGPIPELRVYTLGDDTVAPLRLNPFEFETEDEPSPAPVLSHIDFLKAVFNAAFILYAPMPYVLETALHEVYEDKGWNLATGTNVRLPDDSWQDRHRYPIFPTLSDLHSKVRAVTARLGYEARIEQDVIAGLKARIGSLRLGSKGLMLDTPRGVSMSELLAYPTVLELEKIGNDDEKTFLMGLLLTRIYGYRRMQVATGRSPTGLQHVLVVEEAHRLLQHVSTHVDTEASNLRAHAVETFVNMLSEVRHYGQGVLVADQIPSKLTPDVVKNTSLKVIHRLSARDDRELLGGTMNMDPTQVAHLATLAPGDAVTFAQGDDHPYLITVENFKEQEIVRRPASVDLRTLASSYVSLSQYLSVPDPDDYGVRMLSFDRPHTIIYQVVLRHLDRMDSQLTWAHILACVLFGRVSLPEAIDRLRQQIAVAPDHLLASQYGEALLMLIVMGVAQSLQERGSDKGWPYPLIDSMRRSLSLGLAEMVRSGSLATAAAELDRFARSYESNSVRTWGPYPGCQACRAICLYRSEVSRLMSSIERERIRGALVSPSFRRRREDYLEVARILQGIVGRWVGKDGSDAKGLAYCAALVALPFIGLDRHEQADAGRELAGALLS